MRTISPFPKTTGVYLSIGRSDDYLSLTQTYTRSTCTIRPVIIVILLPTLPINIEKRKNTSYSPTRLIFREVKGRAY